MAYNFKNSHIRNIDEDFAERNKDYGSYIEPALNDLAAAVDSAADDRKKQEISDDITALMQKYAQKFALGITESPATLNAEEKFADFMLKAAEFNPQNTAMLFDSALKMENFCERHDNGILLKMAEKTVFPLAESKNKSAQALNTAGIVAKTLAGHWNKYKNTRHPDLTTHQRFADIFEKSFPLVPSIKPALDEVRTDITFISDGFKLDRDIEKISRNPEDESLTQTFEKHLRTAFYNDPSATAANLADNAKNIAKIADADTRNELYCTINDVIQENSAPNTQTSDMVLTLVGKIMKAEKDAALQEQFALSALDLIQKTALDKDGALLIAEGREKQTFGTMAKIADSCGHRSELKQILNDTAYKYKDNPEVRRMVQKTTIRALNSEENSGKKMHDYEEPSFIKSMRNVQRNLRITRQHNNEICELLNLSYANSDYKYDATKPLKVDKKDLLKAANTLSQYKAIDPVLYRLMLNRIDTKGFTNVDDKVLDAFTRVLDRVKVHEPRDIIDFDNKITEVRTQMHSRGIHQKQKINAAGKPLHFEEKKDKAPKKFNIKFDNDDLDISGR